MFFYMMSVGVLLPARCHASAGISRHRVSVCVFFVTRRYCIKTAKRIITQTRHSGPQMWHTLVQVQLALIGSRRRAFQRAIGEPCTLPLTPTKGGTKRDFAILSSKYQLLSTKVCYKVSLCENFQRQRCSYVIFLSKGP